jgi:hypothetical protein
MKRILRINFGTNNMVVSIIYIFVYFIILLAKPVDS